MTVARIARLAPTRRITATAIDCENPDSSISLPNSAPSRKIGKYRRTNTTALAMNRPVKTVGIAEGSVSSTGIMAATGANRMTLKPR